MLPPTRLIDVLMSCSSDEEEYFTSAEAMGRSDIVGKIDRIACPMLLMHGMCECSSQPQPEPTAASGSGLEPGVTVLSVVCLAYVLPTCF